jgi:hypothetical protein
MYLPMPRWIGEEVRQGKADRKAPKSRSALTLRIRPTGQCVERGFIPSDSSLQKAQNA